MTTMMKTPYGVRCGHCGGSARYDVHEQEWQCMLCARYQSTPAPLPEPAYTGPVCSGCSKPVGKNSRSGLCISCSLSNRRDKKRGAAMRVQYKQEAPIVVARSSDNPCNHDWSNPKVMACPLCGRARHLNTMPGLSEKKPWGVK